MTQCPNCRKRTMYNRNVVGPVLWYCGWCEERYTDNELDALIHDHRDHCINNKEDK